jgi:hypothetical protein
VESAGREFLPSIQEVEMRHVHAVFVLLSAAALTASSVSAAQGKMSSPAKPVTVTGTLIDTKCYSMDHRNKTVDHVTPHGQMKDCAKLCARLGIPVAVLTSQGQVWTLVTPAQDLVDHMGQTARVTGAKVYGDQIRPDKIEIEDAAGHWTEVKIRMPMAM